MVKPMKRYRSLCMLAAVFLNVLVCSCVRVNTMTPAQIVEYLRENIRFAELIQMDEDEIFISFFNESPELVSSALVYMSSSEDKADELVIITPAGRENFDAVLGEINNHVTRRTASFARQSTAEASKLQNAVLHRTNDDIILVVCEEYQKAAEFLKEIGAKPAVAKNPK